MGSEITLCPMNRELLHEYYREFVQDESIYMDMSRFTEYVYTPERVDAYYAKLVSQSNRCDFMIMQGLTPVGEIALKRITPDGTCGTLSIHLKNDSVKNRGIGTMAERLLLDHAFRELGLARVEADCVLKNERSRHVLKKVGFTETGTDETFHYFRILREEWEASSGIRMSDSGEPRYRTEAEK